MPMRPRSLKRSVSRMWAMSSPKTWMEPLSGRMRPSTSFMRTDFPPPAGPRMIRVSPGWTAKETSLRTGLMSKVMVTSLKTTTGSEEPGGCSLSDGLTMVGLLGMGWLPAEDADHRPGDEQVDNDDEDRRDDHSLRGGLTHALGAALRVHAEVAADRGDDECREERLGEALGDVGVLESSVRVVKV